MNVLTDTTVVPAQSDVDVLCGAAVYLAEVFEREWIHPENFVFAGQSIHAQISEEKKRHAEDSADYLWLCDAGIILVRKMGKAAESGRVPLDVQAVELITAFESGSMALNKFRDKGYRMRDELQRKLPHLDSSSRDYMNATRALSILTRKLDELREPTSTFPNQVQVFGKHVSSFGDGLVHRDEVMRDQDNG